MPRPKSQVIGREILGNIGQLVKWSNWKTVTITLEVYVMNLGPTKTKTNTPIKRLRLKPLHALPETICEAFEKGEIGQTQMERALDLVFAELNKRLHRA